MKGLLITLEGLDGSGKSTIRDIIEKFVKEDLGIELTVVREPGTSEIGEDIRDILHSMKYAGIINQRTEALLYEASRAQLVADVIKPKLETGAIILMDRFFDSTSAYQGAGRELGLEDIQALNKFATGGLTPDLTILLDIPVDLMKERLKSTREFNRMDAQSPEFYQKVRGAYLQMATENVDGRWIVVDATRPLNEVAENIKAIVSEKIEAHRRIEGQISGSPERHS